MTKLYSGPLLATPGDVLYTLATVVALDYLHDAWFYWTHRLLHWKPLYVHVHYIHHRCVRRGRCNVCDSLIFLP